MTVATQSEPRHDATRIPVDSVLLYRSDGMEHFELCNVVTVSTVGLEVSLTHPLSLNMVVNFAVRDETSRGQFYRVIGEVDGCEREGQQWVHSVAAYSGRPWSSKFLYDVVCSTSDAAPTLAEKYRVTRGAGLESAHRSASEAAHDAGWNVVQFPSNTRQNEFSLY